ncbi:SPOR domain-containing protein [Litoribacter populi]|uniref:SPOR domain-containing protein n=1 Tax=Litoribacter populi TaxID=2598460 RepID=UPI0011812AC8|nr:SPOR domain-containing protein [Litoribacter populi]
MAEKDNQNTPSNDDADKDFGLPKVKITPLQSSDSKEEKPSEPPVAPVSKPEQNEPSAEESKKPEPEKQEKQSTPVAAAPKVEDKAENKDKTSTFASTSKKEESKKEEKSRKKGWVWAALILLFLGFAAVLFWYVQTEEQEPEPQVAEQPAPTPPPVIEEEPVVEEEPETFTLTQIKSRVDAPRYFLVVGSFIDEDMALDYSERLNENEKNTYLIYPYGQIAYYRLAVGEFENVASALEELNRVQADYQENLWVLKY